MTITIPKERLRELLLKEREARLLAIDNPIFNARCSFCRAFHGGDWRLITDADLQKEAVAAEPNAEVAHG